VDYLTKALLADNMRHRMAGLLVNNELERIRKDTVMVEFLSFNRSVCLEGETTKHH
jgi:hypothetical protein